MQSRWSARPSAAIAAAARATCRHAMHAWLDGIGAVADCATGMELAESADLLSGVLCAWSLRSRGWRVGRAVSLRIRRAKFFMRQALVCRQDTRQQDWRCSPTRAPALSQASHWAAALLPPPPRGGGNRAAPCSVSAEHAGCSWRLARSYHPADHHVKISCTGSHACHELSCPVVMPSPCRSLCTAARA